MESSFHSFILVSILKRKKIKERKKKHQRRNKPHVASNQMIARCVEEWEHNLVTK
jgi:hypothetical protein